MSNVPHSVAQRLLNFSKSRNEEYTFILSRYGLERLLFRLSQSERGKRFILKGASLFLVWFGHSFRTTRDLDLEGEGPSDTDSIRQMFRDICRMDTLEVDGLVFEEKSVQVDRIKEDQDFEGVRVRLRALLARSRLDIQVDIGFGDPITPGPQRVEFPTLLGGPAPVLLSYPPYTTVAEKFHAMVSHDMANSRMKDFYDLIVLFRSMHLEPGILAEAIRRSFTKRGTPLPKGEPTALTPRFSEDTQKKVQWTAFATRSRPTVPMGSLTEVVNELRDFLTPTLALLEGPRSL